MKIYVQTPVLKLQTIDNIVHSCIHGYVQLSNLYVLQIIQGRMGTYHCGRDDNIMSIIIMSRKSTNLHNKAT